MLGILRVDTAGESHGPQLTIMVQNLPAGMPIAVEEINRDLARRQKGYGRGGRQQIERDRVEIVAGVRHGLTMGGPVAMVVKNLDWPNWQGRMDVEPVADPPEPVTRLRPGHADLGGVVKYGLGDVRNVLERASARETAARVAAGALARLFLRQFGIEVRGHVLSVGNRRAAVPAHLRLARVAADAWWERVESSEIRTGDQAFEGEAIGLIRAARTAGDTLGGVFEVVAYGLPIGVGTYAQWDQRLDARLAGAVMSIQSIKGVDLGDGFEAASLPGSEVHDVIDYDVAAGGWTRPTNRAGGLEGGMTNGMPLVVRGAAKPISTLIRPLQSVDFASKQRSDAHFERSDICVVPAAGVVGEAMVALVLADAMRLKFGGDSLREALSSFNAYQATYGVSTHDEAREAAPVRSDG